jgi:hypothetical protein
MVTSMVDMRGSWASCVYINMTIPDKSERCGEMREARGETRGTIVHRYVDRSPLPEKTDYARSESETSEC